MKAGDYYWNNKKGYKCLVKTTGLIGRGHWGIEDWEVRDVFPGRPYRYCVRETDLRPLTEMEVLAYASK
jgi:hypothetical protein